MNTVRRSDLYRLLRADFASFIHATFQTVVPGQPFRPNWHIEAMAHQLELCRRREVRRLIITIPPRNLKSIATSVAFPAFVLGHDPTQRIVCASYAQDLTAKHSRDCRAVMESAWYRRVFRRTRLDPRKNTESEFETTARGYRFGTSVGGTLTGRGGDLIIIDDPLKPGDTLSEAKLRQVHEWYDKTLSTRLDRKDEGVIVLIMQRLHMDDLVGYLLEKGESWMHLDLPAIAEVEQEISLGRELTHRRAVGDLLHPAHESREALEATKISMGSLGFSAQYQQAPIPPGGALIHREWLQRRYKKPPSEGRVVQSWDTASSVSPKNDYSVCTTWLIDGRDYYLLDVFRERLEYPELRRAVVSLAKRFRAMAVLIENAGSGTSLIQDLKGKSGSLRPIPIRPKGDKLARMEGQTAVLESGYVVLPESAPWLGDFSKELLAFPNGRHDDQVDSVSQFLKWAGRERRRAERGVGAAPRLITARGYEGSDYGFYY